MTKQICALAAIAAIALAPQSASADIANLNPTNDTAIWHRDGTAGYGDYVAGAEVDMDTYHFDANLNSYLYIQFDLSSLNIATINSATLTLTQVGTNTSNGLTGSDRNDTLTDGRIDFFGLNNVVGNTAQNWSEGTLSFDTTGTEIDTASIAASPGAPFVTGTVTSFAGEDTVGTGTASLTGANLVTFLGARVSDNGLVTFMAANPDGTSNRGIGYVTKEGGAGQPVLTLDYTMIPEPSTIAMLMGGVGMLSLVRRRRRA